MQKMKNYVPVIFLVPFLNDDYDYYYDDLVASKSPVTPKPEIFQPSPRFVYIFWERKKISSPFTKRTKDNNIPMLQFYSI